MSETEYAKLLESQGKVTAPVKPRPRSKYRSKKTWADGVCFDSKKEAEYYSMLALLKSQGEIAGFCIQPRFILQEGNAEHRAITYSADFIVFHIDGSYEIVDTKGYESQSWKRTKKHFQLKFPELELKVEK